MSHRDLVDRMLALLSDSAEPAERAELEALIASRDADALRAERDAREVLAQLANALTPVAPPPRIKEQLLRRVRSAGIPDSESARADRGIRSAWPLAAAASLIAALVGVGIGRQLAPAETSVSSPAPAIVPPPAPAPSPSEAALIERANAAEEQLIALGREAENVAALRERIADLERDAAEQSTREALQRARLRELETGATEQRGRAEQLAARLAETRSQIDALEDRIRESDTARSAALARAKALDGQLDAQLALVSVLSSPNLIQIDLDAGSDATDVVAQVFWDYDTNSCFLKVAGLDPPPGSTRYALWLTNTGGDQHLVGTFVTGANGGGQLLGSMPGDFGDIASTVVSIASSATPSDPGDAIVLRDLPPADTSSERRSRSRYRRRP